MSYLLSMVPMLCISERLSISSCVVCCDACTVRCEVPTATPRVFYELDSVTLDKPDDIPRAADVVFVVQHAPCNRDVLEKAAGLADSIDKAMRSEGLTSIRYAVVGFGGKQSHLSGAHVHTMDGQIFNVASKVRSAKSRYYNRCLRVMGWSSAELRKYMPHSPHSLLYSSLLNFIHRIF